MKCIWYFSVVWSVGGHFRKKGLGYEIPQTEETQLEIKKPLF